MKCLVAKMDEIIDDMRAWRKETVACEETTKSMSGVQGANFREHGMRSGGSGGPQGICRSETCRRTEDVT